MNLLFTEWNQGYENVTSSKTRMSTQKIGQKFPDLNDSSIRIAPAYFYQGPAWSLALE